MYPRLSSDPPASTCRVFGLEACPVMACLHTCGESRAGPGEPQLAAHSLIWMKAGVNKFGSLVPPCGYHAQLHCVRFQTTKPTKPLNKTSLQKSNYWARELA